MFKLDKKSDVYNFVLTNHGHKESKDVLYNDKICDHLGKFKRILHIDEFNKDKKAINSIKIYTDHTIPINVHSNYYFLTKYIDRSLSISYKFDRLCRDDNTLWTRADNLTINHAIAVPVNTVNCNELPISTSPRAIFGPFINNTRLWFLVGYFLRYGSIDTNKNYKNCIQLTIYDKKEIELLDYLDSFIIHIHTIFSNGLNDYSMYRIEVEPEILHTLSELNDKKTIPSWIHDASSFYLQSFIHGFIFNNTEVVSKFNTDSFMYNWKIAKNTIEVKKMNIEILLSIQLILFKCDIVNSIIEDIQSPITKYRLFKLIIQKGKSNKNIYPFFKDNYVWLPVTYVTQVNTIVKDSDISNEDGNECVINNIVMRS